MRLSFFTLSNRSGIPKSMLVSLPRSMLVIKLNGTTFLPPVLKFVMVMVIPFFSTFVTLKISPCLGEGVFLSSVLNTTYWPLTNDECLFDNFSCDCLCSALALLSYSPCRASACVTTG